MNNQGYNFTRSTNKVLYSTTLLLITVFVFSSCEKFINVDLPEREKKLVVISGFQPEETWSVFVSHSKNSFDNQDYDKINNAEVIISHTDGTNPDTLFYSGKNYVSTNKPVADVNYKIRVNASGFTSANSENKIPGAANIISIDTISGFHNGEISVDYNLKFKDVPGEENYYIVQLFKNDNNWNYKSEYPLYIQSDDPNIEKHGDDYGDEFILLNDQNFDGEEYLFKFYVPGYQFSEGANLVKVKLISCSEEYYRFQKTLRQSWYTNDNPFSQPIQIFTNIEKGIGIFGGYVVSETVL
ncbi:MAG: DUF4249 domain-containing protein [Bacteroidota bacterium]|nr:DUF4249 domain-containing protein [Bacteroidota bacterium]